MDPFKMYFLLKNGDIPAIAMLASQLVDMGGRTPQERSLGTIQGSKVQNVGETERCTTAMPLTKNWGIWVGLKVYRTP